VVVVVVLVMDGEFVDVAMIELACAAAADPRIQLECLRPVTLVALLARTPGLRNDAVEAGMVGIHTLAGRHARIVASRPPQQKSVYDCPMGGHG
jgi:hypothetical protein